MIRRVGFIGVPSGHAGRSAYRVQGLGFPKTAVPTRGILV